MTDYTELKRLAEDVNNSFPEKEDLWNMVCTPTVALDLIADLESLKAEIPGWTERELLLIAENERIAEFRRRWIRRTLKARDERDQLKAENAELRLQCGGMELDIQELKAENEALRKDADRYRWLRDSPDGLDLSLADSMEEIDAQIDAAMSKGEQP